MWASAVNVGGACAARFAQGGRRRGTGTSRGGREGQPAALRALQAFSYFFKRKGDRAAWRFFFSFLSKKKKNPSSPRDFGDRKFCENPASLAGAWTGLTPPLPRPRWPRPPRAPRVYLHARAHAQGLRLPARTYADRASGLVGPVGRAGLRWLFTQCEGVPPSLSCCLLWVPRYRPTTRQEKRHGGPYAASTRVRVEPQDPPRLTAPQGPRVEPHRARAGHERALTVARGVSGRAAHTHRTGRRARRACSTGPH